MLAQFYAPIVGGEERMTEALSLALTARGHDVAVATLRQPGQSAVEERDGIRVHRLPGLAQRFARLYSESGRRHAPPLPDPETVIALRRVLERERPEIVHAHNWLAHAYLPLRRRNPAAFVMSLHDFSLVCANKRLVRAGVACSGPGPRKCVACASRQYGAAVGPPVALFTAAGGRALRRGVDMFLPVSGAVASGCALGTHGERFDVVPNFLPDDPPVAPPDDPRLDGLPPEPFILFVGDVTHDKGVDVLLAAHARMQTRLPLVLIGRLAEPGLLDGRDGVLALGPIAHDGVLAAWHRCAVGVVPSVQPEAFGVVALEASSAGIPVVASAHGGLPDVIADGETGLLVAPGDVAALAAALDRLMADGGLRSRMGVAGAARAQMFSAAAVLPRVEAAYAAALAARLERGR